MHFGLPVSSFAICLGLAFSGLAPVHADPGPTCAELARANRLDPAAPAAAWSLNLWQSVQAAHSRLDPTHTSPTFVVVDRPESTGWYCRTSDVVYLTAPLVDYAWLGRASDGAELLAFVMAHELAHRRFDVSSAGAIAPFLPGAKANTSTCQGPAFERELEADARAAFLVALTTAAQRGRALSPWRLERAGTLTRFLDSEHGGTCTERRAAALSKSLGEMEGLGEVYEVALTLAFAPSDGPDSPRAASASLLARLEILLNPSEGWARIPELSVLLALVHVQRAATLAARSCTLTYPRHPALSPFDALGRRGPRAGTDLSEAIAATRVALAQARRRQLPEPLLTPIDRCLAMLTAPVSSGSPVPASSGAAVPAPAPPEKAWPAFRPGLGATLEALALEAELPCATTAADERRVVLGAGLALQIYERAHTTCYELVANEPLRVVVMTPEDAASASLESWLESCEVYGRGRADDGSEVLGLRCAQVDRHPDDGWTIFARGSEVARIVRSQPIQRGQASSRSR